MDGVYLRLKNVISKVEKNISYIDRLPLGIVVSTILFITFIPYFILGEGSIFVIHDQMDETILSYVLNAKYLGSGTKILPEMLGGINKTGLQPSALLFVPLYRFLPDFSAFLVHYAIVFYSGFWGMYCLVKHITESSILAAVTAVCFCSLPIPFVYGLSVLGVPLVAYSFLCLYNKRNLVVGYMLLIFFGLTTHLVLIGYVVLGLWLCYLVYMLVVKIKNRHIIGGFLLLLILYVISNYNLFAELMLGNSSYVSHREELINGGLDFWNAVANMFMEGGQHAISLHSRMILPICVMLLGEGLLWRKISAKKKRIYMFSLAMMGALISVALLYGLFKSELVADLKNRLHGFGRYFQMERFYWLYPTGWYLEFAMVISVWWGERKKDDLEVRNRTEKVSLINDFVRFCQSPIIKLIVLIIIFIPTLLLIKVNCNFYMNINQINNGSDITGYISWESYYSEDLMQELDKVIGRDKSEYRIAHLGISPAPSLLYGFYTADGYSNNYPLEYKHKFRKVIAAELSKNDDARVYFDTWGSRCYLFNSVTGTYYMVSGNSKVRYENLEFDMKALQTLGCEYLFSGGEIIDAEEMGLEFLGNFKTEKSYWEIWLYQLVND